MQQLYVAWGRRWLRRQISADRLNVDSKGEHSSAGNDICPKHFGKGDQGSRKSSFSSNTTQETFTLDGALVAIGFGRLQWKILFLTGFSWVADAMEMMILSILGPKLHCDWRLPSYQVALITSVVFIGMGFSSPIWGKLSDSYGRTKGLTMCTCWTLYYSLLGAFAPKFGWSFGVAWPRRIQHLNREFYILIWMFFLFFF
ncbi:synaptic vesicle 2-related protein-like [Entelurus aequoreus]|uniref:synaptic vesicle 2-related protein-like n=1 Tax=Entelurus aequoreus TaxID=161455 RepID=UPI002B1DCF1D|nr:synaptic vesicle 2-related protein-like [Entelurus aequoreus]